jgi:hypothetical protein
MGGIAHEPPQPLLRPAPLLERRLDLLQHRVQRPGQAPHLGRPVLTVDPSREVTRRDRRRRAFDSLERAQLSPDEQVCEAGDHRENDDADDDLEQHEPVQGRVHIVERYGDDEPAARRELTRPAARHEDGDAVAGGARDADRGVDGPLGERLLGNIGPERLGDDPPVRRDDRGVASRREHPQHLILSSGVGVAAHEVPEHRAGRRPKLAVRAVEQE